MRRCVLVVTVTVIAIGACKRAAPARESRDATAVDATTVDAVTIDAVTVDAAPPSALCVVLTTAAADLPNNFQNLVGERDTNDENNVYFSTLKLPGTQIRVTLPGFTRFDILYDTMGRDVYDQAVRDLATCPLLHGWQREVDPGPIERVIYRRRASPDDGVDIYVQLDTIELVSVALRP